MKLTLFILFINLNLFSQSMIGLNISFANNRICGGIDYITKKGFGFSLNGGLLGKDEFSVNRGNLIDRLLNKKGNYDFPFYDYYRDCYKGYANGYKVIFYGIKMHVSYNLIFKPNIHSKNYISFGLFVGFFNGSGYWTPTIGKTKSDTILCGNGKINEQIGGYYGGISVNYFISLDKHQEWMLGVGIFAPFYKPLYPYSYHNNINTNPLLSGLEPELKISLIKKI